LVAWADHICSFQTVAASSMINLGIDFFDQLIESLVMMKILNLTVRLLIGTWHREGMDRYVGDRRL
jgi:hypothetical protein